MHGVTLNWPFTGTMNCQMTIWERRLWNIWVASMTYFVPPNSCKVKLWLQVKIGYIAIATYIFSIGKTSKWMLNIILFNTCTSMWMMFLQRASFVSSVKPLCMHYAMVWFCMTLDLIWLHWRSDQQYSLRCSRKTLYDVILDFVPSLSCPAIKRETTCYPCMKRWQPIWKRFIPFCLPWTKYVLITANIATRFTILLWNGKSSSWTNAKLLPHLTIMPVWQACSCKYHACP